MASILQFDSRKVESHEEKLIVAGEQKKLRFKSFPLLRDSKISRNTVTFSTVFDLRSMRQ